MAKSNKLNDKMNKALELTKANVNTKTNKLSNLDIFHEVLFGDEFKTRQQIVSECNLKKLESVHPGFDLDNDDDVQKFVDNLTKAKNMVDTSISNSKNNSAYSYNPKFEKYEIIQDDQKRYKIAEKK